MLDEEFDITPGWFQWLFYRHARLFRILILDNCDDLINNQKSWFLSRVDYFTNQNTKVVITSRTAIEIFNVKPYDLPNLSIEAACDILEWRYGDKVILSSTEKETIANLTDRHPLALKIMRALLNSHHASRNASIFIEKLRNNPLSILVLDSKSVSATIGLSLQYLTEEVLLIGQLLSYLDCSFDKDGAVIVISNAVSNLSLTAIESGIDELVSRSLLSYDNDKTYWFHQLIKKYFRRLPKKENIGDDIADIIISTFRIYKSEKYIVWLQEFNDKLLNIENCKYTEFKCILEDYIMFKDLQKLFDHTANVLSPQGFKDLNETFTNVLQDGQSLLNDTMQINVSKMIDFAVFVANESINDDLFLAYKTDIAHFSVLYIIITGYSLYYNDSRRIYNHLLEYEYFVDQWKDIMDVADYIDYYTLLNHYHEEIYGRNKMVDIWPHKSKEICKSQTGITVGACCGYFTWTECHHELNSANFVVSEMQPMTSIKFLISEYFSSQTNGSRRADIAERLRYHYLETVSDTMTNSTQFIIDYDKVFLVLQIYVNHNFTEKDKLQAQLFLKLKLFISEVQIQLADIHTQLILTLLQALEQMLNIRNYTAVANGSTEVIKQLSLPQEILKFRLLRTRAQYYKSNGKQNDFNSIFQTLANHPNITELTNELQITCSYLMFSNNILDLWKITTCCRYNNVCLYLIWLLALAVCVFIIHLSLCSY